MNRIKKIINLKVFFCIFFLLSVFSDASVVSGEYVKKEYRDYFISPALQQNYSNIETQTLNFFNRQQSAISGLFESFRGSSRYIYDLFTRSFTHGRGGVLDAQSFTYDGAITALCYLSAGQTQRAAEILDIYKQDFNVEKNGEIGLYNSYSTDKPFNGGYAVGIDSRIHLGPNMWVAIAGLQYTALTGDYEYLSFIIEMMKWAQNLKHFQFSDGTKGGVSMGFGWGPDWSQVYSAENNIDYYAALVMLKEIYNTGNPRVKNIFEKNNYSVSDINRELFGLTRWFKEIVYDHQTGYIYMGYNEKGPDKVAALDTVSWAITGIGPENLEKMGIDPGRLMDFAENNFRATDYISGVRVEGYDFTNPEGRKKDLRMVWMEGTGFHTVAFQVMSKYENKKGHKEKAAEYRKKAIKFSQELDRAAILVNFRDYALPYTSRNPKDQEIVLTFADEWEIPRGNDGQWVASASSTGWRYLAATGFNPMAFDKKNVKYAIFKNEPVISEPINKPRLTAKKTAKRVKFGKKSNKK